MSLIVLISATYPKTKRRAALRVTTLAGCVLAAGALAACSPSVPTANPTPPPQIEGCGAEGLQSMVGSPLAAVTLPAYEPTRVYRASDAVTMDFNPARLNIVLTDDGITIMEISCG